MTKREVIKLLAMLSAYYGKSKADAETMVGAWYLLLKDYDYTIAEQAVLEYAKNDNREYSQFPKVGTVIESIKQEEQAFTVIRNSAYYGWEYDRLPERSKKWITEERYNRLKQCPEEYLLNNLDEIKTALTTSKMLTGGKNDQGRIKENTARVESPQKAI